MEMISNSPGANLAIFTGAEIIVHRGNADTASILPDGVAKSVKCVNKIPIYDRMLEGLQVVFNNGRSATLFLNLGTIDSVNDEDLKEFQARCLMLHDL